MWLAGRLLDVPPRLLEGAVPEQALDPRKRRPHPRKVTGTAPPEGVTGEKRAGAAE